MEIDAGQDQIKAKVFGSQRNDLEEGNVRISIQLKYFLGGETLYYSNKRLKINLMHLVYLHKLTQPMNFEA